MILDLARLDCIWGMFIDDLIKLCISSAACPHAHHLLPAIHISLIPMTAVKTGRGGQEGIGYCDAGNWINQRLEQDDQF